MDEPITALLLSYSRIHIHTYIYLPTALSASAHANLAFNGFVPLLPLLLLLAGLADMCAVLVREGRLNFRPTFIPHTLTALLNIYTYLYEQNSYILHIYIVIMLYKYNTIRRGGSQARSIIRICSSLSLSLYSV